jgi:hypothetical protein
MCPSSFIFTVSTYEPVYTIPTRSQPKNEFYEIGRFPNVLGSIDGTIIPTIAPGADEHLYVSRKGYHGLNVQIVNDARLKIRNIVAKWPGSTHDSYIWNMCALKEDFEQQLIVDGWLLGDSGYACAPSMMTPVMNPLTPGDRRYNVSQRRTRNTSERTIGVWKMRFLCIHKSGGCMMFAPARCVKVIIATAILHNICIEHGIPMNQDPDLVDEEGDELDNVLGDQNDQQDANGVVVRNKLIQTVFTN